MAIPEYFLRVENGRELFLRRGWMARLNFLLKDDPNEKIYKLQPVFRKHKGVIANLYGVLYIEPQNIREFAVAFNNKVQFRDTFLKLPELPSREAEEYGIGKSGWTEETINLVFTDGKLPKIVTMEEQTMFYTKVGLLLFITGTISFYSIWRVP